MPRGRVSTEIRLSYLPLDEDALTLLAELLPHYGDQTVRVVSHRKETSFFSGRVLSRVRTPTDIGRGTFEFNTSDFVLALVYSINQKSPIGRKAYLATWKPDEGVVLMGRKGTGMAPPVKITPTSVRQVEEVPEVPVSDQQVRNDVISALVESLGNAEAARMAPCILPLDTKVIKVYSNAVEFPTRRGFVRVYK